MKYKISISILFLLISCINQPLILGQSRTSTDTLSNVTTNKKSYVAFNAGYRFNLDSYPKLNTNYFFGFSLEIPLTDHLSFRPELNIWKSNFSDSLIIKEYSVIDIPLLLVFNILDGNSGFDFSIGPGIGLLNYQSAKLISLNIEAAYWINVVENIFWNTITRLQAGGTINHEGGNTQIISVFVGTGLRYSIN